MNWEYSSLTTNIWQTNLLCKRMALPWRDIQQSKAEKWLIQMTWHLAYNSSIKYKFQGAKPLRLMVIDRKKSKISNWIFSKTKAQDWKKFVGDAIFVKWFDRLRVRLMTNQDHHSTQLLLFFLVMASTQNTFFSLSPDLKPWSSLIYKIGAKIARNQREECKRGLR